MVEGGVFTEELLAVLGCGGRNGHHTHWHGGRPVVMTAHAGTTLLGGSCYRVVRRGCEWRWQGTCGISKVLKKMLVSGIMFILKTSR